MNQANNKMDHDIFNNLILKCQTDDERNINLTQSFTQLPMRHLFILDFSLSDRAKTKKLNLLF